MTRHISEEDLRACLPDVTTSFAFPELEKPVQIFRDRWGIPHIRAENEHDLFFAQGFATAQDRLWHMDADRHRALGRWAEFVGPSALKQDALLRRAGMGRTAKLDYELASSEAKAMVDAYTAGVNAFLWSTRQLPIEYTLLESTPEPWENWHCLAVYKIRNTLLGTFEPKVLLTRLAKEAGPDAVAKVIKGYPAGHLLTVPPGAEYTGPLLDGLAELEQAARDANWLNETDAGSNGWAVSGEFTRSGKPLVAGDSHRALDTPSVYYQVHLACPEFEVIGHSVPGMPGALHFCHNAFVGWGMTHGGADTQDLFIEQFRETPRGREYRFQDEWRKAEVWTERLAAHDASPTDLEVTVTHHGPVIAGEPASGLAVAISDPGLISATRWVDAARNIMRSKSADELDDAFRDWTDRVNNYPYADVHGNFGYLHRGKIPIRPSSNGWRAVPGWTGEHEWHGYIPHEELPAAKNPRVGYAVTCNQRVMDHDYPYYVGLWFTPEFRARRIRGRILELGPGTATVDDMATIHAERRSIPAQDFVQALTKVTSSEPRVAEAIELLRSWDGSMDRDRAEPAIYAAARARLTRSVASHVWGKAADHVLGGAEGSAALLNQLNLRIVVCMRTGDTSLLPPGRDWPAMLLECLREGIDDLTSKLGENMPEWRWGAVHHTEPRHPLSERFPEASRYLDPPSLPTHGDGDTPLAGSYALSDPFVATGMSVNRYIHDPSDWRNSRWIVPLGASGHPASPHYADQASLWANLEYIPQLWDWDQISREAETRQQLDRAGS